jgi:hypothetical protein
MGENEERTNPPLTMNVRPAGFIKLKKRIKGKTVTKVYLEDKRDRKLKPEVPIPENHMQAICYRYFLKPLLCNALLNFNAYALLQVFFSPFVFYAPVQTIPQHGNPACSAKPHYPASISPGHNFCSAPSQARRPSQFSHCESAVSSLLYGSPSFIRAFSGRDI